MRVIIAGGGTGGHVIPALAIAHQLKKQFAAEILFIGTARGIETRLVPQAGYPLELIKVGALKNVSLATRARTMFDLPRALWTAGRMLNDFRPDVVIGVGGYASGPAMLAAIRRRIPTLAFEPNVVPGFANRLVARFVSAAAVHFEETCEYFRNCKVTGVPVREAFFRIPQKSLDAGNFSGHAVDPTRTLLVFGGSQGAHAINQAMIELTKPESLARLRAKIPALHIIHQTGQRDYEAVLAAYEQQGMAVEMPVAHDTVSPLGTSADSGVTIPAQPRSGARIEPTACPELVEGAQAVGGELEPRQAPEGRKKDSETAEWGQASAEVHKFIDDMPATFARADLLVCRSGASTVGEITAAGKPAIFVPFPRAADDHQNVNARALERAGAAVVVEESNLEAAYLVDTIAALLNDPARLRSMSGAAKSLAHPQAVEEIADMVRALAGDSASADGHGST